ncbi:MAG: flagellar basal body P-ring formation chaperone FlgA [Thermodesulfobacteriota bacterium]
MKIIFSILGALLFISTSVLAGEVSLSDTLREYVAANSIWPGAEIAVENIRLKGDELKGGEFDRLIVSSRNGARTTGKVSFNVTLLKGDRSVRTVVAVADVSVLRNVVIAGGPIKMRGEIGPRDVRLAKRDVSQIPANAAFSLGEVVGKEAKRPIQAGSVVREDYLLMPLLVKRGQLINVQGNGGLIVVRSKATAITDGFMGTIIKARTPGGREISGTVSGRGQMVVDLGR